MLFNNKFLTQIKKFKQVYMVFIFFLKQFYNFAVIFIILLLLLLLLLLLHYYYLFLNLKII